MVTASSKQRDDFGRPLTVSQHILPSVTEQDMKRYLDRATARAKRQNNTVMYNALRASRAKAFTFDDARGTYVTATGRTVSEPQMRTAVRRDNESTYRSLGITAGKLIDSFIDIDEYQVRMAEEVKAGWYTNAHVTNGGSLDYLTQRMLESKVAFDFSKIDENAQKITDGKKSDAQIAYGVTAFAAAIFVAYWIGTSNARQRAGLREGKRVLGEADHCEGCLVLAGVWIKIQNLIYPGEGTQCHRYCKCHMVYR